MLASLAYPAELLSARDQTGRWPHNQRTERPSHLVPHRVAHSLTNNLSSWTLIPKTCRFVVFFIFRLKSVIAIFSEHFCASAAFEPPPERVRVTFSPYRSSRHLRVSRPCCNGATGMTKCRSGRNRCSTGKLRDRPEKPWVTLCLKRIARASRQLGTGLKHQFQKRIRSRDDSCPLSADVQNVASPFWIRNMT